MNDSVMRTRTSLLGSDFVPRAWLQKPPQNEEREAHHKTGVDKQSGEAAVVAN